jgi:hypothetical protein
MPISYLEITDMESDKILERIRGLISKAESLEADGSEHAINEANACRERADEMMQKYAVEEWKVMQAAPAASRAKPTRIRINLGEGNNDFLADISTLVNIVAKFCKCSSIWMQGSGFGIQGHQEYSWVYGYESDLRYFEMLFTQLHLHMLGAIFPKPDPTKTLGENIYELHNAGINWVEISAMYGWYPVTSMPGEPNHMFLNRNTGDRLSWNKSIGKLKASYRAEAARRGEAPVRLTPKTYQRNAVQGYINRISQRLREIAGHRGTGTELVLADKSENIAAALAEDFPKSKMTSARKNKYDPTAYRRGVAHANTAALNPQAGASPRSALGSS